MNLKVLGARHRDIEHRGIMKMPINQEWWITEEEKAIGDQKEVWKNTNIINIHVYSHLINTCIDRKRMQQGEQWAKQDRNGSRTSHQS